MAITRNDCITCKVRSCSILDVCDLETLSLISTHKFTRIIPKGDRLFSEGDPINGICFIKKGFLKIELNGKQGRPLILRIAGRGDILGHRATVRHALHSYSATAVSEVHYCFIPFARFEEIAQGSPQLQQQIVHLFLDELELAEKKAVNLAHKSVREKVAEALLLLATTFQYDEKKQPFKISLCRQDIADLAGTTKEQVSKILKDFEKENFIKCSAKKFNYINLDSLRSISGTPTVFNGGN